MTIEISSNLLPVGFYDLLFDEAEKNHHNINSVLETFLASGYRLIKTPLVEFESREFRKNSNSFSATDVISGESLVFRNDITPQISRLLSTRLKQENLPLKLCYVGDVLCTKSEDLHADRQQTQVGVEIIGCDEEKSDYEIIAILLSALKKIGAGDSKKRIVIEFSDPDFLDVFLDEIEQEKRQELRAALMKKNLSVIKNLTGKIGEIVGKLVVSNQDLSGLISELSEKIQSKKIVAELQSRSAQIEKISQFLKGEFSGVEIGFNLFCDRESSYHSRVFFEVFCGNFSYPIACGGRYKIRNSEKELSAVGATIYMNRLRKLS